MAGELDRIRERVRQNRAAARQRLSDTAAATPRQIDAGGSTHLAGTRVFDLVTGLEGEVLGGTVENVVVPTAQR